MGPSVLFGLISSVSWWRVSLLLSALLCLPGGVKILRRPTCLSDYLSISTCEWKMDGPTNCSAEFHLSYLLDFQSSSSTSE